MKYNLEDILKGMNFVPKDINSKEDFITLICPEHGMYYKRVHSILKEDPECPRCNFMSESEARYMLIEARNWAGIDESNIDDPKKVFYQLWIEHKETGLIFQKIGIAESQEDFLDFWNPWKWKCFNIEPIQTIECSEKEALALQGLFQEKHSNIKITIPNEIKFNMNKTYMWDEIWQSKAKTTKVLREMLQARQDNKCAMCNKEPVNPTLDHMHQKKVKGTGMIRNVLCAQCNTFLARIENNAARHGLTNEEIPELLRRTALHLESQKEIIHHTEVPKRKKVGVREWNRVQKYYFKMFPNRRSLPKKPTYVTDSWLELKSQTEKFIQEEKREKEKQKELRKKLKQENKK